MQQLDVVIASSPDDSHLSLVTSHLDSLGASWLVLDEADLDTNDVRLSYAPPIAVLEHPTGTYDLGQSRGCWYRRPTASRGWAGLHPTSRKFAAGQNRRLYEMVVNELDWNVVGTPSPGPTRTEELALAGRFGLRTPATLVTSSPAAARSFYEAHDGAIVKSLGGPGVPGEGPDENALFTTPITDPDTLSHVANAPTLIQEHIEKVHEYRITVVRDEVFAARINSQDSDQTAVDWRFYHWGVVEFTATELSESESSACRQLVASLGLNYGAIDAARTPSGEFVFFEVNVNGQWGWIEEMAGHQIGEAIARVLTS